MPVSLKFEWDPVKAASNLRKHQVSFDEAVQVFKDPLTLTIFDEQHSDHEERWVTIGSSHYHRLVVVVHTWIEAETGLIHVRLISARLATLREIKQYEG